jgi:transcriptional regulator with XRE-family HTH domain
METKSFFIDRLKSARLLNGFSLHDLATAMDNKVSRQALHRWEKGEVIPDQEKIGFLSKALNVSPQYFLDQQKLNLVKLNLESYLKCLIRIHLLLSKKPKSIYQDT